MLNCALYCISYIPWEPGHGWEVTSPAFVGSHSIFHTSMSLGHPEHACTNTYVYKYYYSTKIKKTRHDKINISDTKTKPYK